MINIINYKLNLSNPEESNDNSKVLMSYFVH